MFWFTVQYIIFYTVYNFPAITLLTVFWCDNCTVYSVQVCSYLWCLISMVGEVLYIQWLPGAANQWDLYPMWISGWLMKPSEPSILHSKSLYSSPEGLIHLSALLKLFHFNGLHYCILPTGDVKVIAHWMRTRFLWQKGLVRILHLPQ